MIPVAVASPGLEGLLLSVQQAAQLRDSLGKGRNLALVREKLSCPVVFLMTVLSGAREL